MRVIGFCATLQDQIAVVFEHIKPVVSHDAVCLVFSPDLAIGTPKSKVSPLNGSGFADRWIDGQPSSDFRIVNIQRAGICSQTGLSPVGPQAEL